MSYQDNGGAAFPKADVAGSGMTLRDYFAAHALQGYFASGQASNKDEALKAIPVFYKFADAMLEARKS